MKILCLSDEKIHKYLGSLSTINLWPTLFSYEKLTINVRQQVVRASFTNYGLANLHNMHWSDENPHG